jgi:hypothetical protein
LLAREERMKPASHSARRRARCRGQATFALGALAGKLAGAPDGFRFLAGLLLRWLLIVTTQLHFAEDALALHFFLQRAKGLINVVVTDENLHRG